MKFLIFVLVLAAVVQYNEIIGLKKRVQALAALQPGATGR